MHRRLILAAVIALASTAFWAGVRAQSGTGTANWLQDGGDSQRNAWQKDEETLTPANVKDMKLIWTYQTDNAPRQMHNLLAPLVVGRVTTASGPKQLVIITGISDNLYAVDAATGQLVWKRKFDSTYQDPPPTAGGRGGSTLCPGGLTATPAIVPASTPGKYTLYAVSWDGRLRTLDVATGEEIAPPELFMPPNGKPYSLNYFNGVIYTSTAQGCGGNPNASYAYDLATKKVGTFQPGSGGMWARMGPSVGKDGTMYVGTGDGDYYPEQQIYGQSIIGVKPNPTTKALELRDWYTPSNAVWLRKRDLDMNVTGPIFDYKGKEYIVQSSKECRLWLIETGAMGGEDHRTPVYKTPLICNEEVNFASAGVWGAMASAVDRQGTRWIYVPFWGPNHSQFHPPIEHGPVYLGALAALKVQDGRDGKPMLTPGWLSRDMASADAAFVANGIVFAFASGESTTQRWPDPGHIGGSAGRIAESTHATIYAFDATTGAELWNSGNQIASWNHFTNISVANGRVYLGTYDGKLYSFGLK